MLPPSVHLQISDMFQTVLYQCVSVCHSTDTVTEYLYCHYYEMDSTFLLSVSVFFVCLFKGNDEKEEENRGRRVRLLMAPFRSDTYNI